MVANDAQPGGGKVKAFDPSKIPPAQREELGKALEEAFGTPAAPRILYANGHPEGASIGDAVVQLVQAHRQAEGKYESYTFERLQEGAKVYRRNCLQCHGLPGDGRGPTAPWVLPHPRDYRQGKFKFISVAPDPAKLPARKPRREDLLRVLMRGVEGSSMPSFALLPAQELEDVVSYVIHLSVRGRVEFDTMKTLLSGETLLGMDGEPDSKKATITTHVQATLKTVLVDQWARSQDASNLMLPPEKFVKAPEDLADPDKRKESIRKGYTIFSSKVAGCIDCHTDFGRQVNFRYDDWGTRVRPANVTQGVYRGGRRPIDLFWRIWGGIEGSGMPELPDGVKYQKDAQGKVDKNKVDETNIRDLVQFLQALPYPEELPEDVRHKIYGEPHKGEGDKKEPH
jgi:mono/diheme cytochrome c family protein